MKLTDKEARIAHDELIRVSAARMANQPEYAAQIEQAADKILLQSVTPEREPLTPEEENLIKDILQIIGRDTSFEVQFAKGVGMKRGAFVKLADSIFSKLQNGRLTVITK